MSEDSKSSSGFTLWLGNVLSGWTLLLLALTLALLAGIVYLMGRLAEPTMGAVIILAASLGVALYLVKMALDTVRPLPARLLVWAAAVVTLLVAAGPGLRTVFPGKMLFRGEMRAEGDTVSIPPGVSGRVRLLVGGRLAASGAPQVQFTISGTKDPVNGAIERTFTTARVGRGGRAQVPHDHLSDFYDTVLKKGATSLELEKLAGQLSGQLQVEGYSPWLSPLEGAILAFVALLFIAVVDARVGLHGNGATAAGMALFFGWLVAVFSTPVAVVSMALGAVVLGAMGGALSGAAVSAVVRKFVPQMPRRAASKSA